ncbi:hypothetical protein MVEN_01989700 [Mycena venus]|uniref:Uncharacterized protein n=1 Tax=Mycena venus TaxID=2733690 RepID=A0A8H7CIW0_9AGAR|nr:hypothetical protein MVEN_01989700 [Mycena venus]
MAALLRLASHLLYPSTQPSPTASKPDIISIFATAADDPSAAIDQLVRKNGGKWPPNPSFDTSWPAPLRVYHAAYEIVAPLFPVLDSSTNDAENRKTIDAMRARIRGLLSGDPIHGAPQCFVDMKAVVSILKDAESGWWVDYDDQSMHSAMLGFCACVCFLRHAYRYVQGCSASLVPAEQCIDRWGVSPVVREAQIETSLSFPYELDEPWVHLQRYFGFTSAGGGLSTCLYFNTRGFDTNFKPFYSAVYGLSELHERTADWDARLFLETEHRSLPMYRLIAATISACGSFTGEYTSDALVSLKEANTIFQDTSRFFFDNMKDTNISHALWLAYLQGYTGWGLPGADGVNVSGTSGGHSLTIRTLDAFLGIRPVPRPEQEALHVPKAQRDWLDALREYDIRAKVQSAIEKCVDDPDSAAADFWQEMKNELQKMVQKLRLWRMGHMTRMVHYEGVHRPERVFMTAGLGIPSEGEAPDEAGMVDHLKRVLQERLTQTV